MAHFVFFCNSVTTNVPPPLLCSTSLTCLLNIYSPTIVFNVSSEKTWQTPKTAVEFFGKTHWLTASKFAEVEHQGKCLAWNH